MNVLSRQNPSRLFWDLHYYSMCCTTPAGRLWSWSCIGSQAKSNHTAVWPAGQSLTLWIERETPKRSKAVELHQVLETDRKTKSRSLLSGFSIILVPPPHQNHPHPALCTQALQVVCRWQRRGPGSGENYLQARSQSDRTIKMHSCRGPLTSQTLTDNPYSLPPDHSSSVLFLQWQWIDAPPSRSCCFAFLFFAFFACLFFRPYKNRTNANFPLCSSLGRKKMPASLTGGNSKVFGELDRTRTLWNDPGLVKGRSAFFSLARFLFSFFFRKGLNCRRNQQAHFT